MAKYTAITGGPTYSDFETKSDAIDFVKQHESGEVRDEDDCQVWVHFPAHKWQ